MASAAASTTIATPERAVRTAGIASVAAAVPDEQVPSATVAARLGVDEEWIERRTGVRSRHVAAAAMRLDGLAAEAGEQALAQAGVRASDVDQVLVATTTAEELLPNAAPLIAERLGATRAAAVDLGAACTGFLSALALAAAQVEAGRADTVLVVGADLMTRVTDPHDRSTAALFGDGAGAAVVSATAGGAIGPVVLGADAASGRDLIRIEHTDRFVQMAGHETFRNAVARLSQSSRLAAERAGVSLEGIDLFVYHQANTRILDAVGRELGLDPERVVDCIATYGNTSAATIPIALRVAADQGRLEPGARVLLGAFGAGFTWGAAVVEWGAEA
ncbi:MAG TPA: beta-ketoacyl-ACP synthase 3 [Thermoleophilaceae bacterium]|nr:beta-ketoacyl-ACP synthase 3 [Thermoleophilaceae bacterium]